MADFQELAIDSLRIPLDDIKVATNNFADDNFIGQGGFGKVYKGQLKTSSGEPGTLIAVKRLERNMTGQGRREFLKEIMMLASYKHNNLVSLVGFSDEEEVNALIYKYEVHGSLDMHIAKPDLKWETRLEICLGAARGLEYLHDGVGTGHRVIHRDIKSSNILLDGNWEAKISDFGLSTIGPTNQQFTLLVTDACGTRGYVDPQYIKTGILTKESDVFSFGVVMFEVLCGRLAMLTQYDDNDVRKLLYRLAKHRYDEGKLDEIIIPDLLRQLKRSSLEKFSKVAYECLNKDRRQRPKMSYVVQELDAALKLQIGQIVQTELWGSIKGGYPWSFILKNNQKLRKIIIDHKDWIYSVTFIAEDINGSSVTQQYGGAMGTSNDKRSEIILAVDEEVIGISGTVGTCLWDNKPILVISSLYFKTNKKNYGVYGQPENVNSKFSKSWGVGSLAGFYGRSGTYLDAFGCCLKNKDQEATLQLRTGQIMQTELWGSIKGGYPWSFLLKNNQKLRKIIIDHKEWIYSVTFIAEDINGSFVTQQYGGAMGTNNHKLSEIILDVDEEVIGISGTVGTCIWDDKPILVISSLYFKTNKNNYGVYGQPKNVKSEFSKSWGVGSLAGFHGRSGTYLDAFGCCLKN